MDEIIIKKKVVNDTIAKRELSDGKGNPIPEVVKIFEDWFEIYSENGHMTRRTGAMFVKDVINLGYAIQIDDQRVDYFFQTCDKANKGYIIKEDFINFYSDSCVHKPSVVWDNLEHMGIRNDLKKVKC